MITDYTENNTSLDPDEIGGLKLSHITARDELNRWEQDNILEAFNWIEKQKPENLITDKFILELHRRMFCNVWAWAGSNELAIRFHYRLVRIHIFPNGNGRHAKMMADLIIEKIYHRLPFSWGSADLSKKSTARKGYIDALKIADQDDFKALLRFARS